MPSRIRVIEQCCWDLRAALSRLGPDEVCCEGLTPRQCRVLRAIGGDAGLNLSALAEREGLSVSGMSRRVDPLVERGFLDRARGNADDGRAVRLELTPRGRKALDSVEETIYGGIEDLWKAVPPAERGMVVKALEVLARAAQRIESRDTRKSIPLTARRDGGEG
jgi:DNA-binding MarR family transcriptional regulator